MKLWPGKIRPTRRLFALLTGLLTGGVLVGLARTAILPEAWFDPLSALLGLAAAGLVLSMLMDIASSVPDDDILVERVLPHSFALNRRQAIIVNVENKSDRTLAVSLTDVPPEEFETSAFPMEQAIQADQLARFEYTVVPLRRGETVFEPAFLLVDSRFGLWQFVRRAGGGDEVKVYPDFSAVANSFVFGVDQAMRNMGAHIAKRKGDGMEFNQLREFREGDTLKQIDWKATARTHTPISREYQEEKDQNVIFLLDCSRRMRAVESELTYFDYALNALLMSSYIALDKGDAVGVMTFSGEPSWMPPIKGKTSINQILNHLYALDTSTQSSDYVEAAEQLLVKHRKRSLVILVTNVRDEDNTDLNKAVEILSRQHLVMVVALQESLLSQADQLPIDNEEELMLYAGVKHFGRARKRMLALLKADGVSVVDATHRNIHIQLVTEYLRLKRFGRI